MNAGAEFPIRPNPAWQRSGWLLSGVALATVLAWAVTLFGRGRALEAGLALLLGPPVAALAGWRCQAEGRLRQAGAGWCLEPAAAGEAASVGELIVAFDLDGWMLLRLRCPGSRWWPDNRWFALSQRDMPAQWHAFRRAVYSPRPSPAGLSAQAPADPPA